MSGAWAEANERPRGIAALTLFRSLDQPIIEGLLAGIELCYAVLILEWLGFAELHFAV